MRRARIVLLIAGTAGCAYYNGLYNSKALVRRADAALRDGRDSAAVALWREAAARADSVVQRHPGSRWAHEALWLSGVSAALAGACADGLTQLSRLPPTTPLSPEDVARTTLARGACLTRAGRTREALDTLRPLTEHANTTIALLSAQWAARAALTLDQADDVVRFAELARSDALDAELAIAAANRGRWPLSFRLLRQRASSWRSLPAAHGALALLAAHGHIASLDTIVRLTSIGRAPRTERASLLLAAGAWSQDAGRPAVARAYYAEVPRLTSDSTLVTAAAVAMTVLAVREAETLEDAERLVQSPRSRLPEVVQLDSVIRLAQRLASESDTTGASLFLAAEVVRDGIGARALARSLFRRVVASHETSSLAPKALIAAAAIAPDSAHLWHRAARERYPASPYVATGMMDAAAAAALEHDNALLAATWLRLTGGAARPSQLAGKERP